jgi:hypothetical protein
MSAPVETDRVEFRVDPIKKKGASGRALKRHHIMVLLGAPGPASGVNTPRPKCSAG